MSPIVVIIILAAMLSATLIALLMIWLRRRWLVNRLDSLNDELVAVAGDASVGRRLLTADRLKPRKTAKSRETARSWTRTARRSRS